MIQLSNDNYRIQIADEQSRVFEEQNLVAAVAMILDDHGIESAEISIAIVDDPTIRALNQSYLGHDYETDVISFLLEFDPLRAFLAGQLIVSTDTAATMAQEMGVLLDHELLLYVVHGSLHLVGLDDTDPDSAAEMRAAEKSYLAAFGVDHCWPSTNPRNTSLPSVDVDDSRQNIDDGDDCDDQPEFGS